MQHYTYYSISFQLHSYRYQNTTLIGVKNPIAGDNIHDVVEENLYENTRFQGTASTTYENANFDETDNTT